MKGSAMQAARAVAGVLSAALVGRSGIPVLVALCCLVVLGLGVVCWIVSSAERSVNLSRILFARRGDARYLEPVPSGRATCRRKNT
jgi:hypothetical protein